MWRTVGLWSAIVCGAACTGPAARADPAHAVVAAVVDGDTIDVVIAGRAERVRLLGVDTPEVAHPSAPGRPGNAAECFADEAAAFTAALLPPGTAVRLERDVVARDDYGRLLAYVHRSADGLFVNRELLRRGYAEPLSIAPNVVHASGFVEAARRAERDGVGMWAAC